MAVCAVRCVLLPLHTHRPLEMHEKGGCCESGGNEKALKVPRRKTQPSLSPYLAVWATHTKRLGLEPTATCSIHLIAKPLYRSALCYLGIVKHSVYSFRSETSRQEEDFEKFANSRAYERAVAVAVAATAIFLFLSTLLYLYFSFRPL